MKLWHGVSMTMLALSLTACGSSDGEDILKNGLDQITPESGTGLYLGYFVENAGADGQADDVDIGAMFVNVSSGLSSGVSARMSFQQQDCQANNLMESENSLIRTDRVLSGVLKGNLDPMQTLDKDELNRLGFKSPFLGTLTGRFTDKHWKGNYNLTNSYNPVNVVSSNPYRLSSGIDGCSVNYTVAQKGDFHLYPADYQLGNLNVRLTGVGSTQSLTWRNPVNANKILVSQIDVNNAKNKGNGYVQNRVFNNTLNPFYTPKNIGSNVNYAFLVQAFDSNNNLIAYQMIEKTL